MNVLPVAQRTTVCNALKNSDDDGRTWVLGREFKSHHLASGKPLETSSFPMSNLKNTLPGSPEIKWNRELVTRRPVYLVWN